MDRRLLALIVTVLLLSVGSLGACGDDQATPNYRSSVWEYSQNSDIERRMKELERKQKEQCERAAPTFVDRMKCS